MTPAWVSTSTLDTSAPLGCRGWLERYGGARGASSDLGLRGEVQLHGQGEAEAALFDQQLPGLERGESLGHGGGIAQRLQPGAGGGAIAGPQQLRLQAFEDHQGLRSDVALVGHEEEAALVEEREGRPAVGFAPG